MNPIFAVVDLEATSGARGKQRHIIQIGITYIEEFEIREMVTIDVKPPIKIDNHIVELTGITNEQVQDAPMFEDVADYVATLLEDCIFVAHSSHFDYMLLKTEFERVQKDFSMPVLDTHELAKMLYPTEQKYGLNHLATSRNLIHAQQHNAGSDALVTAQLFLLMLEDVLRLSKNTRTTVVSLLRQKEDAHADFFDAYGQTKVNVSSIQSTSEMLTQEQLDVNITVFEKKASTGDKQWISQDKISQYRKQHSGITYVVSTKEEVDYVLDKYQSFIAFKEKNNFINLDQYHWYLENSHILSISDVYLLVATTIWLQQTTTGDLTQTSISRHFINRLIREDCENTYFTEYIGKFRSAQHNVLTYTQFISHYQDLFNESYVNNRCIILKDIQLLGERVVYEYIDQCPLQETITDLIRLGVSIQDINKNNVNEEVLQDQLLIDRCIQLINQTIAKIEETYPEIDKEISSVSDALSQTHLLGMVDELPGQILGDLQQAFELMIAVLDKYPKIYQKLRHKSMTIYDKLMQMQAEDGQTGVVISNRQYLFQHYWMLKFYRLANFKKIQQRIENTQSKIIATGYAIHSISARNYLNQLINIDRIDLVDMSQQYLEVDIPEDFTSVHLMKENLLVKKLDKILRTTSKRLLIVLPSEKILQKILQLDGLNIGLLDDLQRDTDKRIYAVTAHKFKAMSVIDSTFHVDVSVYVKLPFEAVEDISAQLFQKVLLNNDKNYFYHSALPKMLASLMTQIQQLSYHSDRIVLLDTRAIFSSYQDEFNAFWGETVVINRQKVEKML